MNRKDCREMRREIDQSELGQRLSEQAERHLAVCPACAEFRAERSSLRELVGRLEPVTAPADFDIRLRARIARENDARTRQPFIFRFVMSTPGIAVAALAVMLVGSIVWFSQRPRTENSSNAATVPSGKETAQIPIAPPVAANNDRADAIQPPVAAVVPTDNSKRSNASRQYSARVPVFTAAQTSDFNSSQAQSIRLAQDRAGEVSLTAPVNPMVVSMQDDHGGTRRISLPPISFGSQRMTDNRIPVSMTKSRDW
jgi:hypothetical protein